MIEFLFLFVHYIEKRYSIFIKCNKKDMEQGNNTKTTFALNSLIFLTLRVEPPFSKRRYFVVCRRFVLPTRSIFFSCWTILKVNIFVAFLVLYYCYFVSKDATGQTKAFSCWYLWESIASLLSSWIYNEKQMMQLDTPGKLFGFLQTIQIPQIKRAKKSYAVTGASWKPLIKAKKVQQAREEEEEQEGSNDQRTVKVMF